MANVLEQKLEEVVLDKLEKLDELDLKAQCEEVENIRKLTILKIEQQKADIEYDKIVSQMELDEKKEIREQALYELELEQKQKDKRKNVIRTICDVAVVAIPAVLGVANLRAYRETRDMYMLAEYGEDPYGAMTSNGGRRTLDKGMNDLIKLK